MSEAMQNKKRKRKVLDRAYTSIFMKVRRCRESSGKSRSIIFREESFA